MSTEAVPPAVKPLAPAVTVTPLVPEGAELGVFPISGGESNVIAAADWTLAATAAPTEAGPSADTPIAVLPAEPVAPAAPQAQLAGTAAAPLGEGEVAPEREEAKPQTGKQADAALAAPETKSAAPEQPVRPLEGGGQLTELAEWKARVSRATSAVERPDLKGASENARGPLRTEGGAAAERHREAGRGMPAKGKGAVKKPPEVVEKLPPPEPDPVPDASGRLKAASDRRLPDQTPRAFEKSPQGNLPRLGDRPISQADFRALINPQPLTYGPPTEEEAKEQARLAELKKTMLEPAPVAEGEGKGAPVPLQDKGVPPPPPLPPLTRTDLRAVLARLLENPQAEAKTLLQSARASAYNGSLEPNFPGLGDDVLVPEIEGAVTTQLQGVREQAGISAEEMTQSIAARKAELERQRAIAAGELQDTKVTTGDDVRKAGQERSDAVAKTKDAIDKDIEQRHQAVEKEGDPAAVYARRDRLIAKSNETVGGQVAAYRQAGEMRHAELDKAERDQVLAYQRTAQQDELQILSKAASPPGLATQDLAAASRAWAADQITLMQSSVKELRAATNRTVGRYQDDVRAAGTFAREQLYSWAETTTGERRNFWQALWDKIKGWSQQAQAEAQAWAAVENRRTAEAIAGDLQFVNQLSAAAKNGLTEEELRQSGRLNAAQDAMVTAFFKGPEAGNTIASVAAALRVRLSVEHMPTLLQRFDKILIDKPKEEWEPLSKVARAINPNFNPEMLTTQLRKAVDQWGTDEPAIYRALDNRTPLEIAILRKLYRVRGWGDLDAELRDELSGNELERAKRLMASEPRAADAAALREAIQGAGTDEATIMSVLRNKTPEEREQIIAAYNAMYPGRDLKADLKDDLGGNDLLRADLLMAGNTAAADAVAVRESLHGFWGADVDDVSNVYSQIRQDVSAQAAREGWTTAQMEAEIRRRNRQVEGEFNNRFGKEYRVPSGQSALRHRFSITIFNPAERDLANALADNDLPRADAARIRIEERGLWASDEKINKVLNSQYTRALEDTRRDVGPELRKRMVTDVLKREAEAAEKAGKPWSPADQWERQQALERAYERDLESRARGLAEDNMGALEGVYQDKYKKDLGTVIEANMSGNELLEARDRVKQGGYLTPAQQVFYAVDGAGTKDEELKAALKGRTAKEIQAMREEYEKAHPGRSFDDDILGDVSGRDYFDMQVALEGEPETVQAMLDLQKRKVEYELDTGLIGSLGAAGAEKTWMKDRLAALERDAAKMHDTKLPASERAKLVQQFNYQVEVVQDSIEEHRRSLDSFAETAAMIAGIVAGVIVTALTLGAAGPVVAGIFASLAATAASMATRALVLGRAYGIEAIGVDLAIGAVDVIFAGLTGGMAGRLLGVVGRGGMVSLKQAGPIMSRILKFGPIAKLAGQEAGALARAVGPVPALQRATQAGRRSIGAFVARETAEVAENVAQSLPSAVFGNTLNDANWEHGNPVANIFKGTAMQLGQGVGMGRAMAHTSAVVGKGVAAWKGRGAAPDAPLGRGDILSDRGTPAARLEQWRKFKLENPDASFSEFSKRLDEGILARRAEGDAARQQQRQMRQQLLEGVPPKERGVLADVPIRTVSDAELLKRGAKPGDASILTSENGAAVLLVRDGATAAELAGQGQSLARVLVRDSAGRPVDAHRALPPDMQGRIPVEIDPTLASNTVRVLYDIDPRTGLVTNVRMVAGPRAGVADIQLHAPTVRLMESYAGFLGRVRQVLDRIEAWFTNNGAPPPGSRAWEARLEVEKLPRVIEDRLQQLKTGDLSPDARKAIVEDIANLQRQLDGHEKTLRDMELEPGRGFVAAEGKGEVTQPRTAGEAPVSTKGVRAEQPGAPSTAAEAQAAPPKTVRDVQLDPFWSKAKDEIGMFEPMMRQLEARPDLLSPKDFDAVLKSVPSDVNAARNFVGDLNSVLKRVADQNSAGKSLPGVEAAIKGLASEDPAVRSSAKSLIELAGRVNNPPNSGLLQVNDIMRKFSLADVQAVRDAHPGLKDLDLTQILASVSRDIDADAVTVRKLIAEAGSVDTTGVARPDLRRLNNILEDMGPGPHTETDVRAAIKRQNDLVAQLASMDDDLVKAVLKETGLVPAAGKLLELSKVPEFQTGGKVSGSKVNKFFRREERVQRILKDVVDEAGNVDDARWWQIQETLRNSDVDPLLMNGIIGYYWERVRLQALEKRFGAGNVFDQVNINVKGQTGESRLDAVIVTSVDKDANVVRIRLEEDKTGRAVLSSAQEAVQQKVLANVKKAGAEPVKADPEISVDLPAEVLSQLSDPKKVTVIIEDFNVERPKPIQASTTK